MKRILKFAINDIKNISREPVISILPFAPILAGVGIRVLTTIITYLLKNYLDFNLTPYYSIILGFLIMLTPMLFGFLFGFLMIDERDERLLSYIAITPVTKSGFLFYRLITGITLSFSFTFIQTLIFHLYQISFLKLIPIAIMAGIQTLIFTLLLLTFASNKIEALAVGKALGIFAVFTAGVLLDFPLRLFTMIFPSYWVGDALFFNDSLFVFRIFAGLFCHIIWLIVLLILYKNKIE